MPPPRGRGEAQEQAGVAKHMLEVGLSDDQLTELLFMVVHPSDPSHQSEPLGAVMA